MLDEESKAKFNSFTSILLLSYNRNNTGESRSFKLLCWQPGFLQELRTVVSIFTNNFVPHFFKALYCQNLSDVELSKVITNNVPDIYYNKDTNTFTIGAEQFSSSEREESHGMSGKAD